MGESKRPRLELGKIWKTSWYHRTEIERSELCGCFYCETTFLPSAIERWIDPQGEDGGGQTAMCPRCGIDAVIGSGSGHAITPELLAKMRKGYFGNVVG